MSRGALPYTDAKSPLDRITIDQSVRFGKPCVRGTRITVGDVLSYLAAGMTALLVAFLAAARASARSPTMGSLGIVG